MLGLELLDVFEVGLFLGVEVHLLQRSRSVTFEQVAFYLVPRGLRVGAGQPGDLIEGADLGPSGDLELLLPGLVLVVHPGPLDDLLLGVALAMRRSVLPNAEGRVEGERLELLSWLHQ